MSRRIALGVMLTLAACGREEPEPGTPPVPAAASYVRLSPVQHAVRASLALRGLRPTEEELARVEADPEALEDLVDGWIRSDAFAETVGDMYGEWLLVRADVIDPLPALGPLEGRWMSEMSGSAIEAPLELVRHVVREQRPLTEILTADYTMADPVVSEIYGLPYDPTGPRWQESRWQDGRPHAGLLSDSELWRRHESAGSNFNRLRANLVADVFLCSAFATRDVVVQGGLTISDEFLVAEAVSTIPECVNCHQALDPMAALFFGFKKQTKRSTVTKGYRADCDPRTSLDPYIPYASSEYCYPLELYSTEDEDWWEYWALRPPAYYGQPLDDLTDLGQHMVDDPRFAQCAARRFYSYLSQVEVAAVPVEVARTYQQVLTDADFDAGALAKAIVLSDAFAAVSVTDGTAPEVAPVGLLTVRPEQLARSVEALTGFTWLVNPDLPSCDREDNDGTDCWGKVDLLRSDLFGFRAMAGGIDGNAITRPILSPTPPRELVWERFAAEAAGFAVNHDAAQSAPEARRLLREIEPHSVEEAAVRDQIAALHHRILGRAVAPDAVEVDDLYTLWADKLARSDDPLQAWSLVITALLIDPAAMFY